jgi:hypothetical protein
MKHIITTVLFVLFCLPSFGQAQISETTFDFWVGEWEASWTGQDGKAGTGKNSITKVLDGKVIEENFHDLGSGFKGKSLSVYNPNTGQWHQAWADNQGGYFDFIGEVEGDSRIFRTKMVERNGKKFIQRMRFYDISNENFTWDWESSTDGGENWNLLWRINYTRKK